MDSIKAQYFRRQERDEYVKKIKIQRKGVVTRVERGRKLSTLVEKNGGKDLLRSAVIFFGLFELMVIQSTLKKLSRNVK